MMRTILLAALIAASPGLAEPRLRDQVHEIELSNGMTWLIVDGPKAPVFTGYLRVRVGGADDAPGATGLAHLFEHMAFKGTPVLGTTDFEAEKTLLREIALVGDRLAVLERSSQGGTEEAKRLRARLAELGTAHSKLTDEDAMPAL